MPSGKEEMYLWWSGEAESMFVYYLTGAITIAFIATQAITRSLRRSEPVVTELLHEDNPREMLVTYMLKIVTSIIPGCGCPGSAKVFMQLTGEKRMSQYFQLRSNTGGKAVFQRGYTDIFLFKVPESLGDIKSAELFLAGLYGPLKWKVEELQLYSPSQHERINLPVTATLLEVLDLEATENIFVVSSFCGRWTRLQLLFHQWLAGYGNTVRAGAFTEFMHAMCVFISLFTLLIVSQICYICLPKGDHIVQTEAPKIKTFIDNLEEDDAGPFNIKISSLLIGAVGTSAGCSFLTLCLEILLRSVRSKEKSPGKAYHNICDKDTNETFKKNKIVTSEVEFKRYFIRPLFLGLYTREKNRLEDIADKKHTTEIAFYLKQLIPFLQTEQDKYIKKVETIRRMEQEVIRQRLQIKEMQEKMCLNSQKTVRMEKQVEDEMVSQENISKQKNELNVNEIDVPKFSEIDLSQYVISKKSFAPNASGSYLDILKQKKVSNTTKTFFRERTSEQHEIPLDDSFLRSLLYDDAEYSETKDGYKFESFETAGSSKKAFISDKFDGNQNAVGDEFDYSAATGGKSDDCFIDIPESVHANIQLQNSAEAEELSNENLCRTRDWIESNEQSKASEKGFVHAWQTNQKAWCRTVIKDLCDVIRSTREMLISDELSFFQIQSKLLDNSHSILQLLLVACTVHCNEEQYKVLMRKEMLSLTWHMSMEILVNVLHEIFHALQLRDSAVLADLVLQSHHVMLSVRLAVYPIIYMVQNGAEQLHLLRHIPLEKDLHFMVVELMKGCFELVVKYNLVLWQNLKILLDRKLKEYLDVNCYIQLVDFVQSNIQDHSTEQTIVKRLCKYIEESSREETWDELHTVKFYSTIIIKIQVIRSLKRKISNLTKKKQQFDKVNDLLPKEPKSRLQLLVEKRRKKLDIPTNQEERQYGPEQIQSKSLRHVHWGKDQKKSDSGRKKKEELEKQSNELGHFIENLTVIHERLKRMMEKQGITQSLKGSVLLAQAVLHPHVIVTLGASPSVAGMYQFDNYLHLKRTENLLAQFYEATVKDLVAYMLNTVVKEDNFRPGRPAHFDTLLHDLSVKIDTMAEVLSRDVTIMMHRCIKMEQHVVDIAEHNRSLQVELMDCTPSEMSELAEEEGIDMAELLEYYKNNSGVEENNSKPGLEDTKDIHLEIDTKTLSLTDIIEDLKPLKEYLEYLKHGEILRSMVTQMGHIERAKNKREYFNSVQINNVIDSYYMLDEGDDSQTLTKEGLYQLEHDCLGEDLKPLPSLVKTVTVIFMLVLLVLIVLYVAVIGGQFSTTELQEWMCYFLLSVAVFGLVFEQFRASAVALYVRRWKKIVAHKTNKSRNVHIL